MNSIALIIPVYHDDENLRVLLEGLHELTAASPGTMQSLEVIAVDGAASSASAALADRFQAKYIATTPGRGGQVARGIEMTRADWIWVVHADSVLSSCHLEFLTQVMVRQAPVWGRFDVAIPGLSLVALMMNLRSRLTKICTGDQAMFMHRALLEQAGGYPILPLMEDVEVSKRLRSVASRDFIASSHRVGTSPRRWQQHGVLATIFSMWSTRYKYWRGVSADDLYREYYGSRHGQ